MEKITTIAQLIEKLAESSNEQLKGIYKLIEIPKEEFEPYMLWSRKCYTRNCIVRTDDYELLLLCWEEGQTSPIHSHNDQECWVYNVMGIFEEIRFLNDSNNELYQINDFELNEKNFSYMNDQMGFHILKNGNNGRSASLHLYAKPIDACLIYDHSKKEFELVHLTYHSVSGDIPASF